jgi:lysophospholipase L1-like esterase
MATPRRWTRFGVAVGLTTSSVLATLGVLEIVLRLATPARAPLPTTPAVPPGATPLATVVDFARPYAAGYMANGVAYRANAAGFRGPDYARPKPADVFRIAVIGDSVAMGSGVAEEDTYAARIERALADPPGDVHYEVLNLGLVGLNAGAVVDRLRRVGLPYEPDLIVYGYTLNDIEGPAYRTSHDETSRLMGDLTREQWAQGGSYVARFFRTRFYTLREQLWPPMGSYVWELDDNYFRNPAAVDALDAAFRTLGTIARQRDVCVLILHHTSLWYLQGFHPFLRHHAFVSALATKHGFANKETYDYFRGRDALSLWVTPFDPHPNAEGHALLAQAALDALHALPARCWRRH